jgi:hypothetical protein
VVARGGFNDARRLAYSCRRSIEANGRYQTRDANGQRLIASSEQAAELNCSAAIELDARVSLWLASRLEVGDVRKRRSAHMQGAVRFRPLGLAKFIVEIADGAERGEA